MITKTMIDKFAKKLTQMQGQSKNTLNANSGIPSSTKQQTTNMNDVKNSGGDKRSIPVNLSSININNREKNIGVGVIGNTIKSNCIIIDDDDDDEILNKNKQEKMKKKVQRSRGQKPSELKTDKKQKIVMDHFPLKEQSSIRRNDQIDQRFLRLMEERIHQKEQSGQITKKKKIKKLKKKQSEKKNYEMAFQPFFIRQENRKQGTSQNYSSRNKQQCHQIKQRQQQSKDKIQQKPVVVYQKKLQKQKQKYPLPGNTSQLQHTQNKINGQQLYVYMMNNLLYLCGKIPSKILKLYMKQLSQKHTIPFNKILLQFGTHQIIAKFYETHDIEGSFNEKYIISELEQLVPQLIFQADITNWDIVRKIVLGAAQWFKVKELYGDDWLINTIKKKRKILKEYNINYELTLSMAKGSLSTTTTANLGEEPSASQASEVGYTNLKEFMGKNRLMHIHQPEIQNSDEEILEYGERGGNICQLRYYKRMKEKSASMKNLSKISNEDKGESDEYVGEDSCNFVVLEIEIVKIGCKIPHEELFCNGRCSLLSGYESSKQSDCQYDDDVEDDEQEIDARNEQFQ